MERCTGAVLETYLADYGWTYRASGDQQWKTGFQGEEGVFPLVIRLTETWISFQIQPFLKLSIDWDNWPEIACRLLELNSKSPLAKLSISGEGHIELTLEALNHGFDYEEFCLMIGLLGFYADQFYDDILSHLDVLGFKYTETLRLLT
jgi:hypothetical protein